MSQRRKMLRGLGLGLLGLFSFIVGICVVTLLTPKGLALNGANFPDDLLRSHVAAAADLDGDGRLSMKEISELTSLRVFEANDLSGLEHLTSLKELVIGGDALTEMRVSHMAALTHVRVEQASNLTTATFEDCPLLESTDFGEVPTLVLVTYKETPSMQESIVFPGVQVAGEISDEAVRYVTPYDSVDVWIDNEIPSVAETVEPAVPEVDSAAYDFVSSWYSDWTFVDGTFEVSQEYWVDRCLPYIEEGSDLYEEFSSHYAMVDPASRFFRDANYSVVDMNGEVVGENLYRITVSYYGTQAKLNQQLYDQVVARGAQSDTWLVRLNENHKVIELQEG